MHAADEFLVQGLMLAVHGGTKTSLPNVHGSVSKETMVDEGTCFPERFGISALCRSTGALPKRVEFSQ